MGIIASFGTFVFLRVFSEIVFDKTLSIIACLLCAIFTGFIVSCVNAHIEKLKYDLEIYADIEKKPPIAFLILPFFIAILMVIIFNWFVALGFSENFYSYEMKGRWWGFPWENEQFWVGVMFSIPIIVHFIILSYQMIAKKY